MSLPCEVVAQHLLPVLRVLIAKELVTEHNLSQVATARKLGITQAAISQYLSGKRRSKITEELESDPAIQSMVEGIAKEIADAQETGTSNPINICDHCKTLREKALNLEAKDQRHPTNPR